jgi:hypothetical protein
MGLYTHKITSRHDTKVLYHTCQYPVNQLTPQFLQPSKRDYLSPLPLLEFWDMD